MNLSKYHSWNISRKQLQYLKIARRPLYVEWWPFFTISCFLFIFQFTNFYFISFIYLFIFLHSKKRGGGGEHWPPATSHPGWRGPCNCWLKKSENYISLSFHFIQCSYFFLQVWQFQVSLAFQILIKLIGVYISSFRECFEWKTNLWIVLCVFISKWTGLYLPSRCFGDGGS